MHGYIHIHTYIGWSTVVQRGLVPPGPGRGDRDLSWNSIMTRTFAAVAWSASKIRTCASVCTDSELADRENLLTGNERVRWQRVCQQWDNVCVLTEFADRERDSSD